MATDGGGCQIWQADVFDKAAWRDRLPTALGVISCLGAFGSNDFMQKVRATVPIVCPLPVLCLCGSMLRQHMGILTCNTTCVPRLQICGDSNILVINEAAEAGVPRAAFISVHDYKFPSALSTPSPLTLANLQGERSDWLDAWACPWPEGAPTVLFSCQYGRVPCHGLTPLAVTHVQARCCRGTSRGSSARRRRSRCATRRPASRCAPASSMARAALAASAFPWGPSVRTPLAATLCVMWAVGINRGFTVFILNPETPNPKTCKSQACGR